MSKRMQQIASAMTAVCAAGVLLAGCGNDEPNEGQESSNSPSTEALQPIDPPDQQRTDRSYYYDAENDRTLADLVVDKEPPRPTSPEDAAAWRDRLPDTLAPKSALTYRTGVEAEPDCALLPSGMFEKLPVPNKQYTGLDARYQYVASSNATPNPTAVAECKDGLELVIGSYIIDRTFMYEVISR